jgi:hypothetical protein
VSDRSPSPGWYPEPQAAGVLRWWDGHRWTEHVQAATTSTAAADSPPSPSSVQPPPPPVFAARPPPPVAPQPSSASTRRAWNTAFRRALCASRSRRGWILRLSRGYARTGVVADLARRFSDSSRGPALTTMCKGLSTNPSSRPIAPGVAPPSRVEPSLMVRAGECSAPSTPADTPVPVHRVS